MRILPALILSFFLLSCSRNSKPVILRIELTCTPGNYFDSLDAVLLSDSYSEFDGKGRSAFDRLFGNRLLTRNVKRSPGNVFIIPHVKRTSYGYLFIKASISDATFSAITRNPDFSGTIGDTADIKICIQGTVRQMN